MRVNSSGRKCKFATIGVVIKRADGTVIPLGIIDYCYNGWNPLRHIILWLRKRSALRRLRLANAVHASGDK